MPPENTNLESGNTGEQVTPEVIAKLQGQIDNLNKGIASYRDDVKYKDDVIVKLQQEVEGLKNSTIDEDDDIRLNPEDEKKLEVWARKQGFVSQQELQAEKQRMQLDSVKNIENQAVSQFLEKYPDYDNDENWNKVLSEFQQYRQPTSLGAYQKLLEKIHNDLSGGTGKAYEEGRIKEKLETQTKGRLSLGGGNQGSTGVDTNIDTLQKRYPNLSREEISRRLHEVDSLYPKK